MWYFYISNLNLAVLLVGARGRSLDLRENYDVSELFSNIATYLSYSTSPFWVAWESSWSSWYFQKQRPQTSIHDHLQPLALSLIMTFTPYHHQQKKNLWSERTSTSKYVTYIINLYWHFFCRKKIRILSSYFPNISVHELVILQSLKDLEGELTLYYLIAKRKIQWRDFGTNRGQLQDSHTPRVLSIYCTSQNKLWGLSAQPQNRWHK